MKIDRFDLIAYGGFSNTSLDLSQGEQGLHIIYGDNEAGKSTALRALQGWLFGIEQRCEDAYLHDAKLLRVGGQLSLSSGRSLAFIRRKGHKSTLLKLDNQSKLPDTILQPFLLGLDLPTFQQLHGMNHQKLQEGGEALLSSSSTTGQALFGAAIGTTQLQKIMHQLDDEAKKIFIPRGKNPSLNSLLQQLADGKKQVRVHTLKQSEWQKYVDGHAAQGELLKSISASIQELEQRQRLYQRLQRTRVPLKQRESILEELEELQGLAQLDEHFEQKFYQSEKLNEQAQEQIKQVSQDILIIEERMKKNQPQSKFFSMEDAIKNLYQRLSEQQTNRRQYIACRSSVQELKDKCLQQLQELKTDAHELEQIATLVSLLNYQKRLEQLLIDEQRLNNEQKIYSETNDNLDCEQEKLEKNYTEMSIVTAESLSSLEAVLEKAIQDGNLEEQCMAEKQLFLEQQEACKRKFARLGRFGGDLASLPYLLLPDIGCLERYQSLFQNLKKAREELQREQEKTEQQQSELLEKLHHLTGSLQLPEPEKLQQVRQKRDQKWRQLKEAILKVQQLHAHELHDFEQQVSQSDRLADQLCEYAEQLQQRHHYQEELKQAEKRWQFLKRSLENELIKLKKETLNWRKNWSSEIQPLDSPEHMRRWLENVHQLLSDYQRLKQEENEWALSQQRYKNLHRELKREAQHFCSEEQLSSNLATLIIQCKNQLKREQQRQHDAAELKKRIEEHKAQQTQLQRKQERIAQERSRLQQSWQSIQKGLNLQETSSVEEALQYLSKVKLLSDEYQRYQEKYSELENLKHSLADFNERLNSCLQQLGYKFPQEQEKKIASVNWLYDQLHNALEQQKQYDSLAKDRKEKKKQLALAQQQWQDSFQQTKQCCRQLGIEHKDHIRPLLEKIKRRDELQRKAEELQAEMRRSGDGYTIEELKKELAKVSPEELEDNNIDLLLKESREKYKQHYEEQVDLASKLKELNQGNTKAADCQQRNKQYMSDIQQQAQNYLRLQFAKIILENQIRDYSEKHQDPLLKRASQFFRRLTLDNYSNLKDDLNDHNQPLLFAIKQNSQAVEVNKMSDGTRDQLYLALRLACLEKQYEARESLPLIVDDVLISFDDQRSKAALATLAEFSRSTQVILFTHHRRILEQARGLSSIAGVFFHNLEQQKSRPMEVNTA